MRRDASSATCARRVSRRSERRKEKIEHRSNAPSPPTRRARPSARRRQRATFLAYLRAQYAEVAESVGSQREGMRRVVSRMGRTRAGRGRVREIRRGSRRPRPGAGAVRRRAPPKAPEARAAAPAGAPLGRAARRAAGVGGRARAPGVLWEDRPGVEVARAQAPEQEEVPRRRILAPAPLRHARTRRRRAPPRRRARWSGSSSRRAAAGVGGRRAATRGHEVATGPGPAGLGHPRQPRRDARRCNRRRWSHRAAAAAGRGPALRTRRCG